MVQFWFMANITYIKDPTLSINLKGNLWLPAKLARSLVGSTQALESLAYFLTNVPNSS